VAISKDLIHKLIADGCDVDPILNPYYEFQDYSEIDIPLPKKLFEYQKEAVKFLHYHRGSGLLGDSMGLGKTAEALTYLRVHPKKVPVLIVCPAIIKYNWEIEAQQWAPNHTTVILGTRKPSKYINDMGLGSNFDTFDLYIINYDVLWDWVPTLSKMPFKMVIYDESHYLKTRDSKRTGAAYRLAGIKSKLFMSGTLATNRPAELFVPLSLLHPKEYHNWSWYAERYCGASTWNGWMSTGASNTKELHRRLKPYMLRRLKEDVLTQLPPKLHSVIPIDITNRKEYDKAEAEFLQWVLERHGAKKARSAMVAEAMVKLTYLKSLVSEGILLPTLDWIKEFLNSTNKKLVVFGIHKSLVRGIYYKFEDKAVVIDGSVTPKVRQKAVQQFQTDPQTRLFVGNVQAAGVGITLTAASDVMICEFPWTPGVLDQAEDRLHRISQTSSVMVYYLAARRTIEERVVGVLAEKRKVLTRILDGKDISTQQQSIIEELLTQYENKLVL
jgi:SWI/SNF-related matrix-associated actin-dependent regulator 1 of chromatin subfamily A